MTLTLTDLARLVRATAAFAEAPSVPTGLALFGAVADCVLSVVPVEALRDHLDDAGRRRADAIGDAARIAKFGE